jgi:hypothetical protein
MEEEFRCVESQPPSIAPSICCCRIARCRSSRPKQKRCESHRRDRDTRQACFAPSPAAVQVYYSQISDRTVCGQQESNSRRQLSSSPPTDRAGWKAKRLLRQKRLCCVCERQKTTGGARLRSPVTRVVTASRPHGAGSACLPDRRCRSD